MTELVVLRVERPYATELDFLEAEDWTVTKKSLFLVGVRSYPEGTIIRCELLLATGQQLLVAEGIVARYIAKTAERPAGLVVRFRRMTPASTQFINRVLSNRESSEGSSPSAAHHPIPTPPRMTATTEDARLSAESRRQTPVNRTLPSSETSAVLRRLSSRNPHSVPAPPNREDALSRLRNRV